MKLNIANPASGCQKVIEITEEIKLHAFFEKRISQEVEADILGEEWKGYVLKITGGNDLQGFPMMQGVLLPHRVKLLLSSGMSCFRARRTGERKRKSVRGCIVGPDLSVLSLVIVKCGPTPIPGLTDVSVPRRLGPKRASKIRKLFNLTKDDDVRKFVIRRDVTQKNGTVRSKAPKIQRLVTPLTLQRKRALKAKKVAQVVRSRAAATEYKEKYGSLAMKLHL